MICERITIVKRKVRFGYYTSISMSHETKIIKSKLIGSMSNKSLLLAFMRVVLIIHKYKKRDSKNIFFFFYILDENYFLELVF